MSSCSLGPMSQGQEESPTALSHCLLHPPISLHRRDQDTLDVNLTWFPSVHLLCSPFHVQGLFSCVTRDEFILRVPAASPCVSHRTPLLCTRDVENQWKLWLKVLLSHVGNEVSFAWAEQRQKQAKTNIFDVLKCVEKNETLKTQALEFPVRLPVILHIELPQGAQPAPLGQARRAHDAPLRSGHRPRVTSVTVKTGHPRASWQQCSFPPRSRSCSRAAFDEPNVQRKPTRGSCFRRFRSREHHPSGTQNLHLNPIWVPAVVESEDSSFETSSCGYTKHHASVRGQLAPVISVP